MAKIKPVSFTFGPAGRPVVIDDKGRIWVVGPSGQWAVEYNLPEEPNEAASSDGSNVVELNMDMGANN